MQLRSASQRSLHLSMCRRSRCTLCIRPRTQKYALIRMIRHQQLNDIIVRPLNAANGGASRPITVWRCARWDDVYYLSSAKCSRWSSLSLALNRRLRCSISAGSGDVAEWAAARKHMWKIRSAVIYRFLPARRSWSANEMSNETSMQWSFSSSWVTECRQILIVETNRPSSWSKSSRHNWAYATWSCSHT